MTSLAILIKSTPELTAQYGAIATRIVQLAEHDVLDNPLYPDIKRTSGFGYTPLHHLVAHHAVVLKNTYELTSRVEYRDRAQSLIDQMVNTIYHGGATGMDSNALAWGGIQCVDLCYSDPRCYEMVEAYNVGHCRDSLGNAYCYPMDTAHSRDTVDAIIQFYQAGYLHALSNNGRDLIDKLVYTMTDIMMQQSNSETHIADFIDGTDAPPGTSSDSNWIGVAPGWLGLGAYDEALNGIFASMDSNTQSSIPAYKPNYYATLALNGRSLPGNSDAGLRFDALTDDVKSGDGRTHPDAGESSDLQPGADTAVASDTTLVSDAAMGGDLVVPYDAATGDSSQVSDSGPGLDTVTTDNRRADSGFDASGGPNKATDTGCACTGVDPAPCGWLSGLGLCLLFLRFFLGGRQGRPSFLIPEKKVQRHEEQA